jgi:prepilin-type N-terminal cleavage/methylation domain-containing protein
MKNNHLRGQSGFTAFELIISLFLLGLLLVAVYFAYINSPYSKPATKTTQTSQKKMDSGPCDFNNNDVGCGLNSFTVTAPTSGQKVCLGSTLDIKWTAPADMDAVTVNVREAGLSGKEYHVGTYAATDKHSVWRVENVPPGDAYKVWINSRYKATSVNNHSAGLFTVADCSGSQTSGAN